MSVPLGPIFMGYLLDDSFGYVFTFGIFVYNTFVLDSTTYLVEIIQVIWLSSLCLSQILTPSLFFQQLLFTYPLLLLLIQRMRTSRKLYCLGYFFRYCSSRKHCDLLSMCLLTTLQVTFVVLVVLLPYGWTAFCLSPGRLWLLGLAWTLFIYTGSRGRHMEAPSIQTSLVVDGFNDWETFPPLTAFHGFWNVFSFLASWANKSPLFTCLTDLRLILRGYVEGCIGWMQRRMVISARPNLPHNL